MAPTTESKEDDMLKYLLLVMKHADFKPDYHQIAKEAGLSNANTAQKRFKKFVEIGGFRLVGGAVVEPGESGGAPTTPVKAKAQAKQSAKTPTPNKKRKMSGTTASEEKESEEDVKLEVRSEQEKYRKSM